jgi:hypothetical protein
VFDYPLTEREVHRYLASVPATLSAVQDALRRRILLRDRLVACDGYVVLPGRQDLIAVRRERQAASARMWRKGVQYGRAIARLPFVRMVAITGTLAVNNVEQDADIDYLIVVAPHRVWLTRFLCLFSVQLGKLEGLTICPNYVVSRGALDQFPHSFFVAHELAQMVPLYGLNTYRAIIEGNPWARAYLPNAFDGARERAVFRLGRAAQAIKAGAERLLAGRLGDAWERREQGIKIPRLRREAKEQGAASAIFGPDLCKGHMVNHGLMIREALAQRLQRVGLDPAKALTAQEETAC